ncbi:MAG TPA: NAD(P)-dependent oxidoreductase [Chthonomonadaceae bacterium]|nr:NAD(P)-dependent oxidoreductase [Chthonomonadaceae bacterium]
MKILVTGSEGLIGQALVAELRTAGHEVRTFDRAAQRRDAPGEHIPGDLRDIYAVRQAARGMDAIAHLGAIPGDRPHGGDEVLAVNVQGTWNILMAAVEAGMGRVVAFSSINALGCVGGQRPAQVLPIDDAYPRHPFTPYQLSKHLVEETCQAFTRAHGLTTVCLRPVGVHSGDYAATLRSVPDALRADREKVGYWAYVDVRDVCDATLRALTVEGISHAAFLLSAEDTTQEEPTAALVERYWPQTPWKAPGRAAWLADNPHRALIDCAQAKQVLGWTPRRTWRVSPAGSAPAGRRA